ncbi:lipopolysaccharide biosynthesis protein [Listeria grandensis]|uniref:lipopolysaccharide biosynthesis protein n=1 Tax=Listeria grandensis TaxID=1494963 RepID=UPI001F4C7676|nr:oligosaccharide flippase family protein [Listeria grandensis]
MAVLFYLRKNDVILKPLLIRLGQFSIGSLGAALLNLILIPVTTYFLSPAEYGKTSMFFLAQTFLIYIIYLGFDQAFTREFHDQQTPVRLMKQAMLVPLISSVVLIGGMVGFAPLISTILFADSSYTTAIYLLGISSFFLIFERFLLLLIRMENRALSFSFYNILVKGTILIGTLIALWIGPPTFVTVIYGMLIGQIAGDLLLILAHFHLFRSMKGRVDKDLLKRLAQFGLPVVVGTFLYSLLILVDKIFLRTFADFYVLGIYTAAFKIASALMIIQVSFANFWVPTAYEWYKHKKPVIYYEKVSHIVMFGISLFFLVMLFFKEWIVVILSPAYLEAQYIFPLLCFYPLMMTISETTNLGIVFLKRSVLNIYVSLIALLFAVILNFMLVPSYGAVGAALATGTAYIIFFLARTFFSMRIWEGFSVKRHIIIIGILYGLAVYSAFFREDWVEKGLIIGALGFLFWLYREIFMICVHDL